MKASTVRISSWLLLVAFGFVGARLLQRRSTRTVAYLARVPSVTITVEGRTMADDWRSRITLNPAVLVGKPTIRGLRISVEHVLRALSAGVPESELLTEYPDLEPDDLRACLAYAAELVESERVYPVSAGSNG